ncbi:MAG: PAN domain-containing protein [Hyphomonadaceae bacterium]
MHPLKMLGAAAIALSIGFTAAAEAPIGDWNVDRPGAVYTSLRVDGALACAALCAEDGICMAWTLRERTCELKAVAPAPIWAEGVVSGLSMRAPSFARRTVLTAHAAPPSAQTVATALPANVFPADELIEPLSETALLNADEALLGGPQNDNAHLRPRLAAAGNR